MERLDEIIILGTGRSCCHSPKEKQPGKEVWGVPNTCKTHYVDRVFQLHKNEVMQKTKSPDIFKDFYIHANKSKAHVYTAERCFDLNNAELYPLQKVIDEFGIVFFLNTICYMIAFAIMQNPKKIQCYGVDMRNGTEYITEKGCVEFWLGVAVGRGIKVATTECSNVLGVIAEGRTKLYGYE